jgi:hypothetical protein
MHPHHDPLHQTGIEPIGGGPAPATPARAACSATQARRHAVSRTAGVALALLCPWASAWSRGRGGRSGSSSRSLSFHAPATNTTAQVGVQSAPAAQEASIRCAGASSVRPARPDIPQALQDQATELRKRFKLLSAGSDELSATLAKMTPGKPVEGPLQQRALQLENEANALRHKARVLGAQVHQATQTAAPEPGCPR